MKTLRDIGEDDLIHRLVQHAPCSSNLCEGPGDDCAVVDIPDGSSLQLLKADALVEGIHYEPDCDPQRVGRKAVARVISDFAAMGGRPDRFLITIALPASRSVAWAESLYKGAGACLRDHGALLAGGETSSVPEGSVAVISIAATGTVDKEHLISRSGGMPGDSIIVTGRLGGSIGGKHLDFTPRVKESSWLASNYKPSAMMDLSDGLAKDLPRLAKASGCGIRLDENAIPINENCSIQQAMTDGEDYELLMTMHPEIAQRMVTDWENQFPQLPISVIGELVEPSQGQSIDGGWEHFTQSAND